MKKFVLFTGLLLNLISLFSQDIVYTIGGFHGENAVHLDSILFENLENDTRLLISDLPDQLTYEINLTSKGLISAIDLNDINLEKSITIVKNTPGEVHLMVNKDLKTASLNLFNLSGQKLYNSNLNETKRGDNIIVDIPNPGIYILSVNCPIGTRSIRVSGSFSNLNPLFNVRHSNNSMQNEKSSQIKSVLKTISNNDFSFTIGDSLRVTAFLDNFFTYPYCTEITGQKTIFFDMIKSTADSTGISDVYKTVSKSDFILFDYDSISGETDFVLISTETDLIPGDIITLDLDSTGLLQKVVNVNSSGSSTTVETIPAYMDDLFVNMEIKLNTKLIEPQSSLKSTTVPKDLMKAFTDKEGFIHPVKVIYEDKDGRRIAKSTMNEDADLETSVNIIDFHEDFSKTDLYGTEGDNIHFFIDEGYASFKSDAVFEFNFKYKGELTEDTKVKKGDLNYFKFYLDSKADFQTKLALDMNYAVEKEAEKKLFNMKKVTAKFIVPPGIPLWISFDCDIFGNYHFNADASLHADWGFESHHQLQAGGIYEKETDDFTPFSEYDSTNIIYPLNIDGEVNASARLELYPRVNVKFYNIFGPYAEIVPYIKGNYNAALQSQIILQGNETFLAWNSGIDLGLDLRVGTELSFIGLFEKEFGPKTISCFSTPLWKSPLNIELISELPSEINIGDSIEIQVKVTDFYNLPAPLCAVYFTGDGTFSKQIAITGLTGIASIYWKTRETLGYKTFTATVYNADKSEIENISGAISVKDSIIFNPDLTYGTVSDIDGNTYKTIQIGTQTWMAENLKTTHYNDGNEIPLVIGNLDWNIYSPAYCWFANDEANYGNTYGALYNWYAVNTGKLCLTGWHVPTDAEWVQLIDYLGGSTVAGGKLKERGTIHWYSPNTGATNETGFTALPGGCRDISGGFFWFGNSGSWWSDSNYDMWHSWEWGVGNNSSSAGKGERINQYGHSVRCIKDQ